MLNSLAKIMQILFSTKIWPLVTPHQFQNFLTIILLKFIVKSLGILPPADYIQIGQH